MRARPQHLLLRDEARARKPSLPSLLSRTSPAPASALQSTSRPYLPRTDSPAAVSASSPPFPSSTSVHRDLLPHPTPSTSLWRTFSFLPFLSRDDVPPAELDKPPTPEPESPLAPALRRRGDVVCLSYETLDDGAMRRLMAKSDHRPVIGSYAIYV